VTSNRIIHYLAIPPKTCQDFTEQQRECGPTVWQSAAASAGSSLSKPNDFAREAVGCTAGLGRRATRRVGLNQDLSRNA
jgi:hypothetical protein